MNALILAALFGVVGALIRVSADSMKHRVINRRLEKKGLLFYGVSIVIVGAFLGVVLDYGWPVSLLAGYAGQDILDGVYRVFKKVKVSVK